MTTSSEPRVRARAAVVHLHLYQPPREDPWLGEVEREPEAAPDHDWSARVERTCYRLLVAARVLDADGRIRRVIDTLSLASFDVAPSLLGYMEEHAPATYAAIVSADRASRARLGHGNALAHPFDHVILPLVSRRDKVTQVRWGLRDFRRRFGRDAEGMWLPETAVDDETLDVLAEHGLRFTVVAPHQVAGMPADGWPGRYRTAAGREIALFAYDDALSREVAFGGLLRDGRQWAERMVGASAPPDADAPTPTAAEAVVSVATAAETYGHHHPAGEMALAAMFEALEGHRAVRVQNYASVLARHPATHEVALVERTSWSCPHGVERWRADCGCRTDPATQQGWRAPLRRAVDELTAALHERFGREGAELFGGEPWDARDGYGGDGSGPVPDTRDAVWARELLEMEREALRLSTSGAWFGDDVGRAEVRIILRAASRAIALAGPQSAALERAFLDTLGQARGNDGLVATARDVYVRVARPAAPAPLRVAAGWAAVRAVGAAGETGVPDAWRVTEDPPGADGDASADPLRVVTVADRRIGAESRLVVSADVPGPSPTPSAAREHAPGGGAAPYRLADVDPRAITLLVRPAPDATSTRGFVGAMGAALKLSDVPERARRTVELALRRAVVHRLLDDDDRLRLASGEASLRELVDETLVRAVQRLALDASPSAQARVLGLADLADAAGGGIPADAQTMLARVRGAVRLAERERLAPVAWRLGFSTRAWLEGGG